MNVPRPPEASLALAKTHSRIFYANRPGNDNQRTVDDVILRRGYQQHGFRHVKMIDVPPAEMGIWTDYGNSWFAQGVEYLETTLADVQAHAAPATLPLSTSLPAIAATASTRPATPTADDSQTQAAKALSLANSYVNAGRYDLARSRLQKIVDTYPGTKAAEQAKSLLHDIEGK